MGLRSTLGWRRAERTREQPRLRGRVRHCVCLHPHYSNVLSHMYLRAHDITLLARPGSILLQRRDETGDMPVVGLRLGGRRGVPRQVYNGRRCAVTDVLHRKPRREEAMSDNHLHTGRSLRRAVKNAVLGVARRFGVYITRDPASLAYQDQLRRILSVLKINCVLDVGSYHGDFARLVRRLGYAGLIFSFEPVAANFEALEKTRGDDRLWRTHRLALGAAKGEAPMQVFAGTTFHSFLWPSEYGLARFPDKLQLERTEMVRVERLENILDELLKDLNQPRVFLKVDTQGYDLDVIRGLGTKTRFIAALQIEMAVNPIYRDVTNSFVDGVAYLQPLGFQVSGLFPVTFHSENKVHVVEFDCLMCRAGED